MSTVRKQILLSEAQNERLRKLRAATGISESEIIRRALDSYDPSGGAGEASNEEMRDALAALVEQNAKTAHALDEAEKEIETTEAFLRDLRAKRTGKPAAKRSKRASASTRRAKPRRRKAAAGSR